MVKIVFFEIEDWEENYFKKNFTDNTIIFNLQTLDSFSTYDSNVYDATILSTFAYSQLTKDILEKFPNLQFIATRSTGYDHIDINYCKEKNIFISNVPAYGVHTIAEHAFALLLTLSRKILTSVERTKKGNFEITGLQGMELYNKTLGVLGTGNIGEIVCKIGLGFGMKVIAFNRHPIPDLEKLGVRFVQIDELLSTSDVVSIHLPYTNDTKHLINRQNIQNMKKGSILINTARGPIVETQAVLEALEKGILRGAGLDVLEEECNMREERELLASKFLESCDLKSQLMNHILLNREDVIVTPHNAFNSDESMQQILQTTVVNIRGFLDGRPQNVVGKA